MTSAGIALLVGVAIAALHKRLKRSSSDRRHSSILGREKRLVSLLSSPQELHSLSFPVAAVLFGISSKGFLPEIEPLKRLHPYFEPWEAELRQLTPRLCARNIRAALARMPLLRTDHLNSVAELRRAMLILASFAHAFVWGEAKTIDALPPSISIPLLQVSERLDMPPVLTHSSIVLSNFRLLDPLGPWDVSNFATLTQFYGGNDESYFYMITAELEAVGGPCLGHVWDAQTIAYSILNHDLTLTELQHAASDLQDHLIVIRAAIEGMTSCMKRMKGGCDPFVFFNRVRIFLSGWKSNPTLPHGLWYPVSETPGDGSWREYYGGSAAQSSIVVAMDAAFSVKHNNPHSASFLQAMRGYMPHEHRTFLQVLENRASIRAAVARLSPNPECSRLVNEFDGCVTALAALRAVHIAVVREYILKQQHPGKSDMDTAGGKGTGGTGIMEFLVPVHKETTEAKVYAV